MVSFTDAITTMLRCIGVYEIMVTWTIIQLTFGTTGGLGEGFGTSGNVTVQFTVQGS